VDFPDTWKSCVKAVLLYASEYCEVTQRTVDRSEEFINKCLIRILNIHWPNKTTNKKMWKKMTEQPVLEQLRRIKWIWIGHTLRRSDDSIDKQVLQRMPQGHRGSGRPKNTWKRDLEREMWTAGFRFSWMKMKTAAQDKAGWG